MIDIHRDAERTLLLQVAYYMQDFLQSSYSPVMFEASKALLEICSLEKDFSMISLSSSSSWAILAFDTLMRLWSQDTFSTSGIAHAELLRVMAAGTSYLPVGPFTLLPVSCH